MAVITPAGTYGPSALAVRSGKVAATRLGNRQEALTEASGAMDRAEISREAAKLAASNVPNRIVQVLASSTGRTQSRVSTMRDLAPPTDTKVGVSDFKGTKALVDARAAAAVRVRSIDITVGGPNSAGALKGAPLFKAPEPKTADTQLGNAKIQAAEAEERAKAIAEARAAARSAAQRLQPLGVRNDAEPVQAFRETKPGFQATAPRVTGSYAAPAREGASAREEEAASIRERRDAERREREEALGTNRSEPASSAPSGRTLNFLA